MLRPEEIARAAHAHMLAEKASERKAAVLELQSLKRQARLLQQRQDQLVAEGKSSGSEEKLEAARAGVDVHLALAFARQQWQSGNGYKPPDPMTLDGRKSVFLIKSRFEDSPMWDMEVATVLSENWGLLLDLFMWVYQCERLRSQTREKKGQDALYLPPQQLEHLQRRSADKFGGRFASVFGEVMHRVVRSPWAGPHLRDRGADCLHFFMCIAIMDMFAQLSKADGLTSSSLWSLSVCVCPVPPEDIGSSSLLKRVDDIVCLITVGATISRDHSSVAERNVFKNVKLEGVTYASEFEVVDDSLLVTLPAALSPTRVAMEEVKVPLKLLTKLKQQSAPERVLAAMSPASHSSSEGSPREDRPTKSFTGGIGKEGLKAADASQKALLHFTAPMADEDLITQLLAPGRLELIQRTSNAEEMKTELPRSLSPKRRSQPMIFNQEPNPKFVQSLPSKPHPEARQARANSVSEVHRRSPGLGEDGEAEAPHPKTPTGTGSSASHYSRSNIRSHVSRVTGPGVHTVAGKPLSKSASVSLVSNARDLEKLARSAKSSVTLPVPDTPVRAPRGAAHTKSHGLKKTFLYSPLLLDQLSSPGSKGLQQAGRHTLKMSFTPSAANIDMPDGVVQQLTLRSHVSQSSGMLQPQQLDDEANSTFLTSMPASSVSRTVQKPALAPSSGVSPDRPAVSDELVYANASAKTSHALLARYMSNASSCGTELNEVKEAAVGAVRTVLASKAGTLSGEPVVVKDIADELTKQTNSMFQSLASRSEEARGDSEEVPIAASLEVALRVRKLRSREANRDASQRDKHAASNRDDGSGVSNTDVRKRLAAIERAASVSKPRVQILKWAPVPDRATEFAKEVGFSRVDLLHLDHVRKQRKQRQQIEEERKAFTEAAKQEVAQAQRMFQSTEALLREDVGVLTDSTDTSEVRWLPRPEQATKQKIDSCLRFVALAHEQAAPVEMVEWGLPAADFAKLTRGEAAQRVSLSELRAELHADHSDIV